MMKRIVPTLLLVFLLMPALHCQFPMPVDSLYAFIRSNSIHRNTVDWQAIDKDFHRKIREAKNLRDTMAGFVYLLTQLNDVHSQIYFDNQYYGHYPEFDDTTLAWLKPLNDRAVSLSNLISSRMLTDRIAYVRVPSFQVYGQEQIQFYAQSLFDTISRLAANKPVGFIVDLRLNGGGNLYPMLSGLGPLLGDRIVAYETDIRDSVVRIWEIRCGNFVIGGHQTTAIVKNNDPDLENVPVVILVGPVTKSSGTMTAIAFKGRPNTLFIGEPTADGYTTSNGYFMFAPNLFMNFAVAFVADREMNIYKTTVNPDKEIYQGDDFENLQQDRKIAEAIIWLTRHNGR